jgi:hypothetical protein
METVVSLPLGGDPGGIIGDLLGRLHMIGGTHGCHGSC